MSPASPDRNHPDDDGDRREQPPPPAPAAPTVAQPAYPAPAAPTAGQNPDCQPPPVGFDPGPAPGSVAPPESGPVTLPISPADRSRPARTLGVGVVAGLAITLLGAPLGLLWQAVAPRVPVVQTEDGPVLTSSQPEQFFAADGWFSLLGLGFGVLVAVTAWVVLRRYRGPVALVAVVLGSLGAAVLAWRLGRAIGLDDFRRLLASAPPGEMFSRPPDLRAGRFRWLYGVIPTLQGVLLMPAFGAAVSYTLLAGWSRYPQLRPGPEPDLSWGSPVPRIPPAAPAPPAPDEAEPPHG